MNVGSCNPKSATLAVSHKRSAAPWQPKQSGDQQTASKEFARHKSFEKHHTSMAPEHGEVAQGARSKGLQVGLRLFGFLGPAPGCLWWSKALLNFKGTWNPGYLKSCGRSTSRRPGRQSSSTAHCAGFCATKARPPRRSPPDGRSVQEAQSRPAVPRSRQSRVTASQRDPQEQLE